MSRLKRYATTALSIISLTILLAIGIIDQLPDSIVPDVSDTLTSTVMAISALMAGGTVASDARVRRRAERVDVAATALQIIDRVNDATNTADTTTTQNNTPTPQQQSTQE